MKHDTSTEVKNGTTNVLQKIPYAKIDQQIVTEDDGYLLLLPKDRNRASAQSQQEATKTQICLMIFLTFQQVLIPILVRLAKRRGSNFLPTVMVFFTEVIKLFLCLTLLIIRDVSFQKFLQNIYQYLFAKVRDTLIASVPAVVYAIQNNLYYIALRHINAAEYTAGIQLRILTTALLSVCMLKKVITASQWSALFFLFVGVLMVQMPQTKATQQKGVDDDDGNFLIGIGTVIVMCWTSAFGGVYFELVLKKNKANIWVENFRLCIMTLLFSTFTMFASDGWKILKGELFQGWDVHIWLIAVLSAISGLTVSAVMKYADNIKKTLCQSGAIACTSLLAVIAGDAQLTELLVFGVTLVVISTYFYSIKGFKTELIEQLDKEALIQTTVEISSDVDKLNLQSSNHW